MDRKLKRVLFVLELRKNLFSVGQAADRGYVTTYMRKACYLATISGSVVMTGTCATKLYKLELRVIPPKSHASLVMTASAELVPL